jgi:predicted nucleic acid-binding protein
MTLVELRYLVEKGTFTESEAAEFDDVLGVEDSSFEVVPVDDDVAHAVGRIPREAVADRPVRPDDRSHRIGARSASGYT